MARRLAEGRGPPWWFLREGCAQLELISNVVREGAHRFYFREGLAVDAFHFRVKVD